ncbi:hypothetical protein LCGC14_1601180 [marine sediment metagenome]|uniref:Uncharacterized protein n=1 Tax=marine sediment metagenome TaxID=412755 RepID=A0A0F9KRS1_9ZZZZ
MKKILIALSLLAATVGAETSPQLDSIRIAAFNQIGIPAAGTVRVPVATANAIINYGIQEVSTNFPAVEKLDTISIDSASEGGALASDFVAIKWCQLMVDDTLRIPLEYKSEDSLFPKRPSVDDADADADDLTEPRYYYTHNKRLMTFPKVKVGDVTDGDSALFLIAYFAVGDRLDAETDSTNILEAYRDELLDWVCYRLEYLRYRYNSGDRYFLKYDKSKKEIGFKK